MVNKKFLYILITSIFLIVTTITISTYMKNKQKIKYTYNESTTNSIVAYPNADFAVLSDVHYYEISLGTTGTAFEKYLLSDRKLLRDSSDLLNLAIDNILKSKVKFVLISGDLTKDGELLCHQNLTKELTKLTKNGIKVYVIPGNHDINNPFAYSYNGDKTISVPSISDVDFANIYKDFGYGSAIYRDQNSLSYVAEPVNNLWIVGIDALRYKENKLGKEEIVGGKLTQDKEKWLSNILNKAIEQKKAVIILTHHGIVEHWNGQASLHPDYLIQDYKYVGKMLASYNIKLAFTGHYHAQDITLGNFKKDGFLYDVETGSLLTAPCPIRYCSISDNKLTIKSISLVDKLHPGTDFTVSAKQAIFNSLCQEALTTLNKYHISKQSSKYISEYAAKAFEAHYNGDENLAFKPELDEKKFNLWEKFIYSRQKYIIEGIWNDLPPSDNNVTIDLEKLDK